MCSDTRTCTDWDHDIEHYHSSHGHCSMAMTSLATATLLHTERESSSNFPCCTAALDTPHRVGVSTYGYRETTRPRVGEGEHVYEEAAADDQQELRLEKPRQNPCCTIIGKEPRPPGTYMCVLKKPKKILLNFLKHVPSLVRPYPNTFFCHRPKHIRFDCRPNSIPVWVRLSPTTHHYPSPCRRTWEGVGSKTDALKWPGASTLIGKEEDLMEVGGEDRRLNIITLVRC